MYYGDVVDIYSRSLTGLGGGGLSSTVTGSLSSQATAAVSLSSIGGGPVNVTTATKLQNDYNAGAYGAAPPYGIIYGHPPHIFTTNSIL